MRKSVAVIGIDPGELPCLRMLLQLLRHPDPTIPELARHALVYLAQGIPESAEQEAAPVGATLLHNGIGVVIRSGVGGH